MDDMFYYKHYITVDNTDCITDGFSDAFRQPAEGDICIEERGGYQFRLFPGGTENPVLFYRDTDIPLYRWDGGKVVRITAEELQAVLDILDEKPEPTQQDRLEAQIFYTAMMTDTLLEV